jgi:hypothetical protein
MGTIAQPAPTRTKTTIFKETLPPNDGVPNDAKPGPFYDRDWETVVNALTPVEWGVHKMRVYRADEKWDRGSSPVDNIFTAAFTEEDIRARFGGGRYILWLYGPPKFATLVAKYQINLDGPPIMNSVPRNGQVNGSDSVAIEAMRMASNPDFMRMQMEMMRTGMLQVLEVVKSQFPTAQDPLTTLRNAKEILGVGTSQPQTSLLDTLRVLKELGLVGSPEKKGIDEILGLITTLKTSGLITSGVPKADLASTFATNLPMLADRLVSGFQEIRLKTEAEERVIRMQRGEMRPGDPNVITLDGQPSSAANAAATAGAAPATAGTAQPMDPATVSAIIVQHHLHRLVQGIKHPDSTGQDMYDYLVNAWPEVLTELSNFTKDQLLIFFKSREMQMQQFGCDVLAEVGDDPRLPKMIEDFLKIAKEEATQESVATQANAATTAVI